MVFEPPKYFRGLSKTRKAQRRREIAKFGAMDWRDPRAYVGFKTDRGVRKRKSHYTADWHAQFPEAKSLAAKAAVTGVPLKYIRVSYNRGLAAWRTGHRPGATQQQWGYARVHSFLLKGKTYWTTDADLARAAKAASVTARRWFSKA